MSELEESLNRQAIRREYIRTAFIEGGYSLLSETLKCVIGTPCLFIWTAVVFMTLSDFGIISDLTPPHTLSMTALLYAWGPVVPLLSWWVFARVEKLERLIRHRMLVRVDLSETRSGGYRGGRGTQVDEVLSLEDQRRELVQRHEMHAGEPRYEGCLKEIEKVECIINRKLHQLLGFPWVTVVTSVFLLGINWITVGSQFYYGAHWAFTTKWVSVPILILWIVGVVSFTTEGVRELKARFSTCVR